jgi:hypothetical protein
MVTNDVQCVGQTQLVIIQKDLEKLPMSITIGRCNKTTQYQTNVRDFNGNSRRSQPSPIMLGFDILLQLNLLKTWKLKGGKEDNQSQQSGVNAKVVYMIYHFGLLVL